MNLNRKEVVFVITSEAKIEAGDNDLDLNLAGVNVEVCLRDNPAGGMVQEGKKYISVGRESAATRSMDGGGRSVANNAINKREISSVWSVPTN